MSKKPFRQRIAEWLLGPDLLATITTRIDDSPGWQRYGTSGHDRHWSENQELYTDALTAWRKNPIAWRIIAITSDYVIGDGITLDSDNEHLKQFINEFWNHPQNQISSRLETMNDELSRAGDLFPILTRNIDGLSYLRFLTKDQVIDIQTAKRDWETELVIHQIQDATTETRKWYTPNSPKAKRRKDIILHYSINKPLGSIMGEGDLNTIIPWLLRYSRMLEDRVRLNWASRAFLWFVTVPTRMIKAKQQQYAIAPEPGSDIVKDEGEEWDMKTPNLRGRDATADLKAVRNMIDAGAGFPPHWRGEGGDVNLATALSMQEPSERHLKRRQDYFVFILMDITLTAYQRAHAINPVRWPKLDTTVHKQLFKPILQDITKADNKLLSESASALATAFTQYSSINPPNNALNKLFLKLILKFAGEEQTEEQLAKLSSQ